MPFDDPSARVVRQDHLYRERLFALCRVLEAVSDDAFDLSDWARNGSCSSVACAVGWAMRDEWFRQAGLGRANHSPAYAGLTGWKAVRRFFGLSREEAFYLFHAARYDEPTRPVVLARIRAFAEHR